MQAPFVSCASPAAQRLFRWRIAPWTGLESRADQLGGFADWPGGRALDRYVEAELSESRFQGLRERTTPHTTHHSER